MKNTALFILTLCLLSCKKEIIVSPTDDDFLLEELKGVVARKAPRKSLKDIQWNTSKVIMSNNLFRGYSVACSTGKSYTRRLIALKMADEWQCIFQEIRGSISADNFFSGEIITESIDGNDRQSMMVEDNQSREVRRFGNNHLVNDTQSVIEDISEQSIAIYRPFQPPGVVVINGSLYYWVNMTGGWGGTGSPTQEVIVNYLSTSTPGDGNSGGSNADIVEVEYHDWLLKPTVNIEKLFKCFDDIPDFPGATYEISLYTDLPYNSRPMEAIDFLISPGHTFVSITKSNGNVSVTQSFGFYPVSGVGSLGLEDVASKVVDDSNHEINAGIKISMSQYEFSSIRANAIYWAAQPYNIKNNNCSDFALNLFNLARPVNQKITLPPFTVQGYVPLTSIPFGFVVNNSPQALFVYLKTQKDNGSSDAPNIIVDQTHGTHIGVSKGECN